VMKGTAKRNDISSNAVAMTLFLTYLTISTSWIYGWMLLNTNLHLYFSLSDFVRVSEDL
jgi:hypothetical protein